ncbi:MAG TPA: hypothetical protein VIJ92_00900 [Ginsengibacter sp.]
MRKLFLLILIIPFIFLSSCESTNQLSTNGNQYVPFTKDLLDRINSSNLDIKKVQFFIDQRLILRRTLGSQKSDIKGGQIIFENGSYIHEVIIPKYTPGICDGFEGDRISISFELQNNDIKFGPHGNNQESFTLSARNWNNGTGEITYDNATYTVKCAACPNVAVTTLLVKKSEAHKLQKTQRIVRGRKVSG